MKNYSYINKSKNDIKVLEIIKKKDKFYVTFEFKQKCDIKEEVVFLDIIIYCRINNKNFHHRNILNYENIEILDISLYQSAKENGNISFLSNIEKLFFMESLDDNLRSLNIIIRD